LGGGGHVGKPDRMFFETGFDLLETLGTRGDFHDALRARFSADERLALSRIPDRESIVDSIRSFLGGGR